MKNPFKLEDYEDGVWFYIYKEDIGIYLRFTRRLVEFGIGYGVVDGCRVFRASFLFFSIEIQSELP